MRFKRARLESVPLAGVARLAILAASSACAPSPGVSATPGRDASADGATTDAAVRAGSGCPSPDGGTTTVDPATPSLTVAADENSAYGLSDPSLAWPSGSVAGYLSYTSLATSALFTRVAKTTDGATFAYVGDVNAYADLTVTTTDPSVCGASTCDGRLVHETSSLVVDPGDPDPTRRFKLFDYSYVIVPSSKAPAQHAWGYIGLYTAPAPEAGWSAGAKAIGWTSTAPGVSSQGAASVVSGVPDLADCAAFTEPAALVDAASGALYLALGCATQSQARVVLLRSGDHAATFTYVGALLAVADGATLGSASPGVMPSDFFQSDGATYLVVSTLGPTPAVANAPSGYSACATVRIDDLASAAVHRDAQGRPVVARRVVAPAGAFAGACAFEPHFAIGYLVDVVDADAAAPNRMLPTGISCP